jgi:hypothetical protein
MRQVLRNAVILATLAGTGWLLIATSPPPPTCEIAGPVRYQADTTCGPAGIITVSNDEYCDIQIEGAEALNLPDRGGIIDPPGTILTSGWYLYGSQPVADAGTGDSVPSRCEVKRGTQEGVLSIECDNDSQSTCSGTLTQQP